MKVQNIQTLFRFDRFVTDSITFSGDSVKPSLPRDRRKAIRCPNYGRKMRTNKTIVREIYDLPLDFALCVRLRFETAQGKCPCCGTGKTFLPTEVREGDTTTKRLQQFAYVICQYVSPTEVACILPFSDDTIRRWNKCILDEKLREVVLDDSVHPIRLYQCLNGMIQRHCCPCGLRRIRLSRSALHLPQITSEIHKNLQVRIRIHAVEPGVFSCIQKKQRRYSLKGEASPTILYCYKCLPHGRRVRVKEFSRGQDLFRRLLAHVKKMSHEYINFT